MPGATLGGMPEQTILNICADLLQDLRQASDPRIDIDAEFEGFVAAWLAALDRAAGPRLYRVLTPGCRGYHEHAPTGEEAALWQAAHDGCHRNDDGTWV